MTLLVLAAIGAGGCRQLFGIEDTEVGGDGVDARAGTADAAGGGDAPVDGPVAPDALPILCPVDYVYAYGGHRYRFVGLTGDGLAARSDCADDVTGTHLAIPDTPEENLQLSQWITQRTWIGIGDVEVEGQVTTALGQSPLPFENWENGQPNNDPNADCVSMRDALGTNPGTWRIESCGLNRPYVCECPGN